MIKIIDTIVFILLLPFFAIYDILLNIIYWIASMYKLWIESCNALNNKAKREVKNDEEENNR